MNFKILNIGKANVYLRMLAEAAGVVHENQFNTKAAHVAMERLENRLGATKSKAIWDQFSAQSTPRKMEFSAKTDAAPSMSNELSELRSKVSDLESQLKATQATPKEPEKPGKPYAKIMAASLAAFGKNKVLAITQGLSVEEYTERLERALYFSNIKVEGADFSHIAERWGPAKELHGLARISHAEEQRRVNEAIKDL
jgi:hypothetical protein